MLDKKEAVYWIGKVYVLLKMFSVSIDISLTIKRKGSFEKQDIATDWVADYYKNLSGYNLKIKHWWMSGREKHMIIA